MANRIYELANDPAPASDVTIIIDKSGWAEAKSTTKEEFFDEEVTARVAGDDAIIDGCGLDADGALSPDPASNYLKNGDFLAAAYDVNIRNALRLLDAAIGDLAGSVELTFQFNITTAEILALNGTPVTKMTAPAAGEFYHVMEVIAKNNFVSVAYATFAANGIYVRFVGASDYIAHMDQTFVQAAATVRSKFPVARHDLPLATGIEVYAPDGDPVNGDGNIDVQVRYIIESDFAGGAGATSGCCIIPLADTFDNGDLTGAGNLVIHHLLDTQNLTCFIIDNTGASTATAFTVGDESGADDNNYITVAIGGPIAGTWSWFIVAKP